MNELKGHGVALITPFKNDGAIDFEAIPRIIDHLINGGVNYLVVLGTTAESATLSNDEKKQLTAAIVDCNAGRLPLVIGIGGNNTHQVIEGTIRYKDVQGRWRSINRSTFAGWYTRPFCEDVLSSFEQ